MKRIFAYLSVVAILAFSAVSCMDKIYPKGTEPTPVVEGGEIEVSVSNVRDNSFLLYLAPKAESAFYSYVITDEPIENVDPELVYTVSYGGISEGTFDYRKGGRTQVITIEDLEPNTEYFIYAVTTSIESTVGKVASTSVTTTDGVAPVLEDFTPSQNQVLLVFTEDVTYDETKDITADVYAKLYLTGTPVATGVKASSVKVSGNEVLVTFADIVIPGSYFVVNYAEGTFADSIGNPCAGLESNFQDGVYSYLKNAPLTFTVNAPETYDDYDSYITATAANMINKVQRESVVAKIVHDNGDGSSTTTEYNLGQAPYYGAVSYYDLGVKLKAAPAPADEVTFTVLEGAVQDIYGNVNDEFVMGPFVYAYTAVWPQECKYVFGSGEDAFGAQLVAAGDTPEDGYLLYADWFAHFDGYANPILYFTVDEPSRTITCNNQRVKSGQLASAFGVGYYYYDQAGTMILVFWGGGTSGGDPIVMTYDDEGYITSTTYFDYSVHDANSGNFLGVLGSCDEDTEIAPVTAEVASVKPDGIREANLFKVPFNAVMHFSK